MIDAEYRKLAAVEDRMWYFGALRAWVERDLRQGLLPSGRAEVLDAGCGTGGLIRGLASRNPQWAWSGVDVSATACELARTRVPSGVAVREASITALPSERGAFDAVVCADVLYHLDDDAAALRELHRVLRPGGLLIVNVPAHPWLWSYHDVAVAGRRRYSDRDLLHKLAGAGFRPGRLTHWNSLLFPLIVVRRKLLPPPQEGSDVHEVSAAMNAAGALATRIELALTRMGPLPFGSSLFAVATALTST